MNREFQIEFLATMEKLTDELKRIADSLESKNGNK